MTRRRSDPVAAPARGGEVAASDLPGTADAGTIDLPTAVVGRVAATSTSAGSGARVICGRSSNGGPSGSRSPISSGGSGTTAGLSPVAAAGVGDGSVPPTGPPTGSPITTSPASAGVGEGMESRIGSEREACGAAARSASKSRTAVCATMLAYAARTRRLATSRSIQTDLAPDGGMAATTPVAGGPLTCSRSQAARTAGQGDRAGPCLPLPADLPEPLRRHRQPCLEAIVEPGAGLCLAGFRNAASSRIAYSRNSSSTLWFL